LPPDPPSDSLRLKAIIFFSIDFCHFFKYRSENVADCSGTNRKERTLLKCWNGQIIIISWTYAQTAY
jgi:hypothetical protein